MDTDATSPDTELAVRLLESSPDGLLLVGASGTITLANRAAHTMFGYADGELVGRLVDDLVATEHREQHVAHRQRYQQRPQRRLLGGDLRLFGQHCDGTIFPVEISLSPFTANGEVQTVATVRDVTEQQESRARLLLHEDRERIARDLHDLVIQRLFAAGMSLQAITNLIDSPAARDRIVAVTDELDETIRAIRAAIFSVGTNEPFQTLTSQLQRLVHERSRHLGFTPELVVVGDLDTLPDFVADQLVATMSEAVSNMARHAEATDASIRITRTAGRIDLRVRDNGRGMSDTPKPLGGLSNLMWRAAELGGSCSVSPVDPTGTELIWNVPV